MEDLTKYTPEEFEKLVYIARDYGTPLAEDIVDYADDGAFKFASEQTPKIGFLAFTQHLEEYYPEAYRLIFKTAFDMVPMDIGDGSLKFIVHWRLKISK